MRGGSNLLAVRTDGQEPNRLPLALPLFADHGDQFLWVPRLAFGFWYRLRVELVERRLARRDTDPGGGRIVWDARSRLAPLGVGLGARAGLFAPANLGQF